MKATMFSRREIPSEKYFKLRPLLVGTNIRLPRTGPYTDMSLEFRTDWNSQYLEKPSDTRFKNLLEL
jgi:hypothetical protein